MRNLPPARLRSEGSFVPRSSAARRRRAEAMEDHGYLDAKESIARFYAANLLPQAEALAKAVVSGGDSALALAEDQF